LKKDVEWLLKAKERDWLFIELESSKAQDEEDKYVEDFVNVNEDLEDDDDKEREIKRLWAEYIVK